MSSKDPGNSTGFRKVRKGYQNDTKAVKEDIGVHKENGGKEANQAGI